MTEISSSAPVSPGGGYVPTEVSVRLLKESLETEAEAMKQLLASAGVGQNVDETA